MYKTNLTDAFLDDHLEKDASDDPDGKAIVEMTLEDLKTIVEMTKVNYVIGQNRGFVAVYQRAINDAIEELAGYMAEWEDTEKNQNIISFFIALGGYLKDRKVRMQDQIDLAVKEGYKEVDPNTFILING